MKKHFLVTLLIIFTLFNCDNGSVTKDEPDNVNITKKVEYTIYNKTYDDIIHSIRISKTNNNSYEDNLLVKPLAKGDKITISLDAELTSTVYEKTINIKIESIQHNVYPLKLGINHYTDSNIPISIRDYDATINTPTPSDTVFELNHRLIPLDITDRNFKVYKPNSTGDFFISDLQFHYHEDQIFDNKKIVTMTIPGDNSDLLKIKHHSKPDRDNSNYFYTTQIEINDIVYNRGNTNFPYRARLGDGSGALYTADNDDEVHLTYRLSDLGNDTALLREEIWVRNKDYRGYQRYRSYNHIDKSGNIINWTLEIIDYTKDPEERTILTTY